MRAPKAVQTGPLGAWEHHLQAALLIDVLFVPNEVHKAFKHVISGYALFGWL